MDEIEIVKSQIVRPATIFETGGFKPNNGIAESWIGKIYVFKEDEGIPLDKKGKQMIPLIQLNLTQVEIKPDSISDTKIITVFISENFPVELTPNGENWLIREYDSYDELAIKNIELESDFIKPFPLKAQRINEDYPVWDGGGLSDEIEDKILELEESEVIESYYDITENQYGHKAWRTSKLLSIRYKLGK